MKILGVNTDLQNLPRSAVDFNKGRICEKTNGRFSRSKETPPQRAGNFWSPPGTSERNIPAVLLQTGAFTAARCSDAMVMNVPREGEQRKSNRSSHRTDSSRTLISGDTMQRKKSRGGQAWERLITSCFAWQWLLKWWTLSNLAFKKCILDLLFTCLTFLSTALAH